MTSSNVFSSIGSDISVSFSILQYRCTINVSYTKQMRTQGFLVNPYFMHCSGNLISCPQSMRERHLQIARDFMDKVKIVSFKRE